MKKGTIALLSALALAFVFAGCSSDGSISSVNGAKQVDSGEVKGLNSFPPIPELPES